MRPNRKLEEPMKHRLLWAGALSLATTLTPQITTLGQTNGVIMIVTRYEQDLSWYLEDGDVCDGMKVNGGGQCSQGDVAMAELLGDYGYPTRVIIDMELNAGGPYSKANPYTGFEPNPVSYLAGGSSIPDTTPNPDYKACLIIQSGSANSSRAPLLATNGVPYMSGEHAVLGSRANKHGSIFMYYGGNSDDQAQQTPSTNQWMKVTAEGKAHPIMQGIPLDANDCVKIYRDPYPEETMHLPVGGKPLWEVDIPFVPVADAAPATTVLGLYGSDYTKSIFAVVDVTNGVGGLLANGQAATVRMVHYYVSEGGAESYRRVFNSLSDMGRLIFVRAAKWAMGETLPPYQALGIIKVSQVNPAQIKLAWTGTATKSYKVLGTVNLLGPSTFSNWQTVAQDIPGVDGVDATTVKLDISAAPQYAFLRVMPVP
jgi:hypothetical protein